MSLKTNLIGLLHHIRDLQLTFHERLSEAERTRVGVEDDWSAKDNLSHNMFWAKFHLTNLETFEREGVWPEREDGGDFDKTNAEIFARYKHDTWDDVHALIRDTHARVDAYLAHTSEEDLLTRVEFEGQLRPKWRMIAGDYVMHPMIHMWDYLRQHGQMKTVAQLFGDTFVEKLLALSDDAQWHGTTLYNLACIYALSGETDRAIDQLGEALRLAPDLTEWSKQDSDLDSLRDEPAFQALYA